MLTGVLLHVVATARGVDLAANAGSRFQVDRSFEIVDQLAILVLGDFGDAKFGVWVGGDPAGIEDLAAAGRIERRLVENNAGTWGFEHFADFGVEIVEEGIVVVETRGHGRQNI